MINRALMAGAMVAVSSSGCKGPSNSHDRRHDESAIVAAGHLAESMWLEARSPDAAKRDRLAPDHCKYRVVLGDSLDTALAGTDLQVRWPLRSRLAWTAAPDSLEWLSPAPIGETTISVDLLIDSVTDIEIRRPAVEDPKRCPEWVKFSADLVVHTDDAVLDTRAHGEFRVKRGRATGVFTLDMLPALPPEPNIDRDLGISLEIPPDTNLVVIEILGHKVRRSTSPRGYSTVSGGPTTLASNVTPGP